MAECRTTVSYTFGNAVSRVQHIPRIVIAVLILLGRLVMPAAFGEVRLQSAELRGIFVLLRPQLYTAFNGAALDRDDVTKNLKISKIAWTSFFLATKIER